MKRFSIWPLCLALLASCSDDRLEETDLAHCDKIYITGEIEQVYLTRASDDGFADGDVMGVYIVDYNGTTPGSLLASGNRGDNVRHTYQDSDRQWKSEYDVYWKDRTTHIDVYGYYPYSGSAITDIHNYRFSVKTDQSTDATSSKLSGYEASDFLWGKTEDAKPEQRNVHLALSHRMSSARIEIAEGEGFDDGEFRKLESALLVKGVRTEAFIDMSSGVVTATGEVSETGITPYYYDGKYRSIIVPQTIAAGTTLFAINIDGKHYEFKKTESFEFVAGKMHNFTIRIDKYTQTGQYKLTLISESITAWENDPISHNATTREYVVVNCPNAGRLQSAIQQTGKKYEDIQNLKIIGKINDNDFTFMRTKMLQLQCLNLKEVLINYIPPYALSDGPRLKRIMLPDQLKRIGPAAFLGQGELSGSLILPEGLEVIETAAFQFCKNLTGSLRLPTTLKTIENEAFYDTKFVSELVLPEGLESIGQSAFQGNTGLYGELHLPSGLKKLGNSAFRDCPNLTGNIEIPKGIKTIEGMTFYGCSGLNGNLMLHDDITSIEEFAFYNCKFRGELLLPKKLRTIGKSAFAYNGFSGSMELPENLTSIGEYAFCGNWLLQGTLRLHDNVSIGSYAFSDCSSLEGLVISEQIEALSQGVFNNCFGIGSIVCEGAFPPTLGSGAFDGVPKDNITLEVPEGAENSYRTANGWNEFKRIAAHHELVCRPAIVSALQTECKRTLVLNAEGEWEVESIPEWCSVSQTNGNSKTELELTIHRMNADTQRTGEIVFRLKNKNYKHRCIIRQYAYQHEEDEILTLQKATQGSRGGVNIFIVGDGYDAKDISEGNYLSDMQEEIGYFFDIEPYKSYRDYFNVYTGVAVSAESGVGTVNTIRYNHFNTTFTAGVGLKADYDALFDYAMRASTISEDNINETLIIVIPNSKDYGGICQMWSSGAAIAFCPKSDNPYPLDARGVIQHEAGGHGFGKLGDEYIYHNVFIDFCVCSCCPHNDELAQMKGIGFYDNLELTGKMDEVGWSHLIFDPRYSSMIDIFEGGFMHSRSVFRSEQNSCMNNDIPYYSTISRESMVRRIKRYAGEEFSFEEFAQKDLQTLNNSASTRATNAPWKGHLINQRQFAPMIHKDNPLNNLKRRKR